MQSDPVSLQDTKRLFSPKEWQEMYPSAAYEKELLHYRRHQLHYLTAFLWPDQVIGLLKTAEGPRQITVIDEKNHKLTPLMIAAIFDLGEVVQALWNHASDDQRKIILRQQDDRGWTTLHYAKAYSSPEVYQFLTQHEKEELKKVDAVATSIKNQQGATAEDLDPLLSEKTAAPSMSQLSFGQRPLEESSLKSLGIKSFRDTPYYPPIARRLLWEQESVKTTKQEKILKKHIASRYDDWKTQPPKLKVALSEKLKGVKGTLPFELVAEQNISKGEIIGECGGEIRPCITEAISLANSINVSHFSEPYSQRLVSQSVRLDMKERGNATRFVNCGFPNATLVRVPRFNGCERHFLVASEAIAKGASILQNYGLDNADQAFGKQVLFRPEEMKAFFSTPLNDLLDEYRQKSGFEKTALRDKLLFPLENFNALLFLYFHNKVLPAEWSAALLEGNFKSWKRQHPSKIWIVYSLLERLKEFDDAVAEDEERWSEARDWILNHIGRQPVVNMIKALAILKETGSLPKNDYWNDYDWTKDTEHPLSIERRREDMLRILVTSSPNLSNTLKSLEDHYQTIKKLLTPEAETRQIHSWVLAELRKKLAKK